MQEFEIVFYEKEDGTKPVEEFLDSLDDNLAAKTVWAIRLLREKGNRLREPYSKVLRNGIMELRTKQGSDITRVLYFFQVGRKIVLTNGFVKRSRKAPRDEIERAIEYKNDWERRNR